MGRGCPRPYGSRMGFGPRCPDTQATLTHQPHRVPAEQSWQGWWWGGGRGSPCFPERLAYLLGSMPRQPGALLAGPETGALGPLGSRSLLKPMFPTPVGVAPPLPPLHSHPQASGAFQGEDRSIGRLPGCWGLNSGELHQAYDMQGPRPQPGYVTPRGVSMAPSSSSCGVTREDLG